MASLNKCIFIGNLGRDPEIKTSSGGKDMCNFSIAVSRKAKGEEQTEWIRVICFDKLASTCGQYLRKGQSAYVEGRLQTRTYQKDGVEKMAVELIANEVVFLGGKGQHDEPAPSKAKESPDEELPF